MNDMLVVLMWCSVWVIRVCGMVVKMVFSSNKSF